MRRTLFNFCLLIVLSLITIDINASLKSDGDISNGDHIYHEAGTTFSKTLPSGSVPFTTYQLQLKTGANSYTNVGGTGSTSTLNIAVSNRTLAANPILSTSASATFKWTATWFINTVQSSQSIEFTVHTIAVTFKSGGTISANDEIFKDAGDSYSGTLPEAAYSGDVTGMSATYTHLLNAPDMLGLSFSSSSRTLSGTLKSSGGKADFTYKCNWSWAKGGTTITGTVMMTFKVIAFKMSFNANSQFSNNPTIKRIVGDGFKGTLPAATVTPNDIGGTIAYALTGDTLGLTKSAAKPPILSGTLQETIGSTEFTYTATWTEGMGDSVRTKETDIKFTISLEELTVEVIKDCKEGYYIEHQFTPLEFIAGATYWVEDPPTVDEADHYPVDVDRGPYNLSWVRKINIFEDSDDLQVENEEIKLMAMPFEFFNNSEWLNDRDKSVADGRKGSFIIKSTEGTITRSQVAFRLDVSANDSPVFSNGSDIEYVGEVGQNVHISFPKATDAESQLPYGHKYYYGLHYTFTDEADLPEGLHYYPGFLSVGSVPGVPVEPQERTMYRWEVRDNWIGKDTIDVYITINPASPPPPEPPVNPPVVPDPVVPPAIASISDVTRTEGYSAFTVQAALSSGTPGDWALSGIAGAAISGSGLMTIPAGLGVGTHTGTVRHTNSAGSDTEEFRLTVNAAVIAPVIADIADVSRTSGYDAFTVQASLSSGTLGTWALSGIAGAAISGSGLMTIPAGLGVGEHTATVRHTNSAGSDTEEFTLTVNAAVIAPVIADIADVNQTAGYSEFTVQAALSSGTNPLTWSLSGSGASINDSSGLITVNAGLSVGSHSFTVEVRNSVGSDTETFSVVVSAAVIAPVIADIADVHQTAGYSAFTVQAALSSGTTPVTWSLSGSGGSIDSNGLITVDAGLSVESHSFTVEASNSAGSDTETFSVVVSAVAGQSTAIELSKELVISEIMLDTGRNFLPQWIEITNNSKTLPADINGWRLHLQNQADVDIKQVVTISLGKVTIEPKESILIVSSRSRDRSLLSENKTINLWTTARNKLGMKASRSKVFSETGFYMSLADSSGTIIDEVGNISGNRNERFDSRWKIPTDADLNIRSSLIRIHKRGKPLDGTERAAWMLAINTRLRFAKHETYWGHRTDVGTPGYRGGRPLPVSLSSFEAEHLEGEIAIRWTTASETNNAGFNILRSETHDGAFKQINAKLIVGQGTTAERTAYTWNDFTVSNLNTTYYYRIQEVGLDGNAHTLRQTYLKGFISASGKTPAKWSEIKRGSQ